MEAESSTANGNGKGKAAVPVTAKFGDAEGYEMPW
jgi:hypothetical protein